MRAERLRPEKRAALKRWSASRAKLLLSALLGVSVIGPLLARFSYFAELSVHFKPSYAIGAAALALVLGIVRAWPWFAAALVCLALNAVPLAQWHWLGQGPEPPADATRLRIVIANVLTSNSDGGRFRRFITESAPDVLIMLEVNRNWLDSIEEVGGALKHRIAQPQDDNFGIAVYSRYAFEEAKIEKIGLAETPSILAKFVARGTTVSLLATHTVPPIGPWGYELRNDQLEKLGEFVQSRRARPEEPWIVAGDLNATMWSPYYKDLLRQTGLRNARRGFGVQATWPSGFGPFKIPLDHCLVSKNVYVTACQVGPPIGSDHRPLVIDLAFAPPF